MSARHRAREHVLKALYAFELGSQTREQIIETVIESGALDKKTLPFARNLFSTVVENVETIDDYISALAVNWEIDRIAIVDKNILRLAITEVKFMPDIPIKVAINEAIELAKKYSTFESASFVNGILDHVMHDERRLNKEEEVKDKK